MFGRIANYVSHEYGGRFFKPGTYGVKHHYTALKCQAYLFLRGPGDVEMRSQHLLCDFPEAGLRGLAHKCHRCQSLDISDAGLVWSSTYVLTEASNERHRLHWWLRLEKKNYGVVG